MFFLLAFGELGDYSTELEGTHLPTLAFIIFVISIFFITLVMLNLVIAIISDTYENVKTWRKLASNFEKAVILLEIEKTMSRRTKKNLDDRKIFYKYLVVCFCHDNDEKEDFKIEKVLENMGNDLEKIKEKN